ncbi:MAG: DUF262 domain-containing protein [Actinobacteria bacterium]|nr:MAG: DUF262 domain-containing protein [Actinomycetota bacterium]
MEISKIQVQQLQLSDIVNDFKKGNIRIPRFQRNYVWDRPRVAKLLNSIYHEYPIGTFFFWEASPEYSHLYRNIPELEIPSPANNQNFHFILDGQQRITSLYVVIKGLKITVSDNRQKETSIDYSGITFDLDKEEFVIKNPDADKRYISLQSILGEEKFEIFSELNKSRQIAFQRCSNIFDKYPLSVVYVREQSITEACEIFERINQGGIKLALFDLVVASTWSNDFDLKVKVNKINSLLDSSGFGAINPDNLLMAISLFVKGAATRKAILSLKSEDIKQNWDIIEDATKLAVDYVRSNLGVKVNNFLPYSPMLPMIIYLFAKINNRSLSINQKKFVEEWFWKATFSERYRASTPSMMGEDRRDLFDPIIANKKVAINYKVDITKDNIKQSRLYKYTGLRNGIFCLLAAKDPLHFQTAAKFSIDRTFLSDFNSPEKHHLFPRAYLREIGKSQLENSLANFTFIPAELNNKIRGRSPKQYSSLFNKDRMTLKRY